MTREQIERENKTLVSAVNAELAALRKKLESQKIAEEQERLRKIQEEMEREKKKKEEEGGRVRISGIQGWKIIRGRVGGGGAGGSGRSGIGGAREREK